MYDKHVWYEYATAAATDGHDFDGKMYDNV
jgi:hypothetical protein